MGKDRNLKWVVLLVAVGLCAALGFYLRGMSESDLNRLLVKWLSITILVLLVSGSIAISVLWSKANGEARYREGSQAALRSRIFPSPTPYRAYTPPTQGYGDYPPPPPPEQRPQLRMLPDGLFSDANEI